MIPDGWVIVFPMQSSGYQVAAFRSKAHAQAIADGFPPGFVKPEPLFFVPDERE